LRIKPFFDACSYSCRRVYGNVPPYCHVTCCNRLGLASKFARKSPESTGAISAELLAILRVYVSVTLSAAPCAFMPAKLKSFITLSKPCTLILILVIRLSSLTTRPGYASRFLLSPSIGFHKDSRCTPLFLFDLICRIRPLSLCQYLRLFRILLAYLLLFFMAFANYFPYTQCIYNFVSYLY